MFSALSNVRAASPLSRSSASEGGRDAGPPSLGSGSAADLLGLASPLAGALQARKECNGPPVPHNGVEAIFLFNPTLQPARKTRAEDKQASGRASAAPALGEDPGSFSRKGEPLEEGDEEDFEDEFEDARGDEERQSSHEEETEEDLGAEERTQEAKIVFYFPATRPAEEKRSHVGLIEGLAIFTQQFSGDSGPLRSIYTDEHVLITKEVEQNYWLTLVFNARELGGFTFTSERKGGADPKAVERLIGFGDLDEDNQEMILMGVLDKFYQYFRLLHGRFALFVERRDRQHLSDLLEDYCPAFLDTVDPQSLSLFHMVDGFHFGPLDRLPYLHLPSFVSVLQNKFPCILHAALLLNGCLLFCNLSSGPFDYSPSDPSLSFLDADVSVKNADTPACRRQTTSEDSGSFLSADASSDPRARTSFSGVTDAGAVRPGPTGETQARAKQETLWRRDAFRDGYDVMRVLYSYLVHVHGCASVNPDKLRKAPYARVNTAAARPGGGCSSFGRAIREVGTADSFEDTPGDAFLFGPTGESVFLPVIHLPDDSTGSLVVINQKQLQLVLVLSDAAHLVNDASFLQHVRAFALEAGLGDLQQAFSAAFDSIMKQEDAYRFIYFNHVNRAVRISNRKCPVNAPSPPSFPGCTLSKQEVRRMGQFHRHLHRNGEEDSPFDMFGSTSDDAGKRGPQRLEGDRPGGENHKLYESEATSCSRESLSPADNDGFVRDVADARTQRRPSDGQTYSVAGSGDERCQGDKLSHAEEGLGSFDAEGRSGGSERPGEGTGTRAEGDQDSGDEAVRQTRKKSVKTRVSPKPVPVKLMAVKDAQSGWLIGSASMDREFYVALDDPRTTLSKAMEDASRFGCMHFANIFV
ncbi:conserved hypothetical protein [Neospora caninum Liverpool]|uniref:CCZ1/INTU/HSP4 first Longin domain-containing protein n=1 Tax=Neospora caninum (strain Liverpool) TaxID=572307 RepID=F0V7V9_NEOCL|nr:conserved hypothetical protein [Neospora caninum Liverpool]CBZ49800.1 conserved hypothetical protein [Neospora caninum Liverpool]CEL64388.1 TPA: hypothetical protein BN1204_002880 [Neospora caninum Liverpool]|eukprot:XP_003879835.1 conserved hypothetical protein [Neospora caninum Liverpool]